MGKVILQGFILVPNSELEVVKRELLIHKELTLNEPGCIVFEVTADDINPLKFNVYEEFVDETAFDNHQARVKCSNWGAVTKNVERNYQITNGQ